MAFGKVYCFGPSLRAEKSKTRRHINEFWQIEPEMIYYDLDDNIELQEQHLMFIIEQVLENCEDELKILGRDIEFLKSIETPFPRLKYEEAVEVVNSSGKLSMEYGESLGADEEEIIAKNYDKPSFITHFPVDQKPFYMKHDPENPELTLSVDMLAPEGYGEIVGGGVREEDVSLILTEMEKEGIPRESLEWYLDLRRFGSVPHSGYGLGIDRTVMWLCGIHHIREAIPFPRTLTRLYP
jgi:asparaginyl-tRNA synthetase